MSNFVLSAKTQEILKAKIAAKEAADAALREALALTFASIGAPEDSHVHFDGAGNLVIHAHTHDSQAPVVNG